MTKSSQNTLGDNNLIEKFAEAVHNAWWNEKKKQNQNHPDMKPYNELPEETKEYDRATARAVFNEAINLMKLCLKS